LFDFIDVRGVCPQDPIQNHGKKQGKEHQRGHGVYADPADAFEIINKFHDQLGINVQGEGSQAKL